MMRITICALFIALSVVQSIPSVPAAQPSSATQRKALARKKWPEFIVGFRKAVRMRDKSAIRSMMVPDFLCNLDGTLEDVPRDKRDAALQFLDSKHGRGWKQLEQVQRHGTRFVNDYTTLDGYEPNRMAPPWADSEAYTGVVSTFGFGPDDEWHWMGFFGWDC